MLTDEEIRLPVRTPESAANIQELNLIYLKFIDSFILDENIPGRNKPTMRLIINPVP